MIDPKRIQELDEILKRSTETTPKLLWDFMKKLQTSPLAFTRAEAFDLTKVFLTGILAVPSQEELPDIPTE